MNEFVKQIKIKIANIKDIATERSYYPALCNFFEEVADSDFIKFKDVSVTVEETTTQYEGKVGFPDLTIRNKNQLIGWVEVKIPEESISAKKFGDQFSKYKDSLENIIFTNLREWQLWQWKDGESKQIGNTILFDLTEKNESSFEDIKQFLIKFFEGRAYPSKTPKQLALILAKKTRFLSKQVEEAMDREDSDLALWDLRKTFEKTLIQDISTHQFSNMVAETMAYSLFLSSLEHERRGNVNELTLTSAIDYLPTNVPILADLYELIKKIATSVPSIYEATKLLVDQLNASEISKIRQKLVEHRPEEDPVVQFYEPFLTEYDPTERKARGVYYTPKPIVDYIVRSVDSLLKNKFGKEKGLADESVNILDPATGTGTFLMSAIQVIHESVEKKNLPLGEEMVAREFNKIVLNHILKHFYGFELLIAPYAIAHLKLTLEIERLGFNFKLTKNDYDNGNDRFKVYLANTLDDPNKNPQSLYGFDSIPDESRKAQEIKRDSPIIAIIGNPPYSNFGQMNRNDWILGLLEDYKKGLNEKKLNLDDDFIKFIRFAQWKLNKTGQGIFAMITSNTFIDGITHRQMRRSLMDNFNEIYIYNLHGGSRKGEVAPNDVKDENVFKIQQGVSINIFVKLPGKHKECLVKYCDLWGTQKEKFNTLFSETFNKTFWKVLSPKEPNWYFVPKDLSVESEYEKYEKLTDVFPYYNSAIQTKRDALTIQFDKNDLLKIIDDFKNLGEEEIRNKYGLPEDGRDWTIKSAKDDLKNNSPEIIDILYRPFDLRKTLFTGKTKGFIAYPRTDLMRNFIKKDNIGLFTKRQMQGEHWSYISATKDIAESAIHFSTPSNPHLFPLYIYSELNGDLFDSIEGMRRPNISLIIGNKIAKNINENYYPDGTNHKKQTKNTDVNPEKIFYYAYAIFHSPTYRSRYIEQLRSDFPRLPITSNKELFNKLSLFGNELLNLHLLGENPLDLSKTILDETSKWNVKIGGYCPKGLKDWQVNEARYEEKEKRIYINNGQYFEGVEKVVWEFIIGGYQVCERWLNYRKKAVRILSTEDLKQYMKIIVALRETIRIMNEIDKVIPSWPME
jgi:predicted helicase